MSVLDAVLLGIVQGLTEFLPVSSSGHLVLAQAVLDIELPGVVFEVTVHVATLGAVLWAYRRRVTALTRGLLAGRPASVRYVGLLALATVPAVLVGFYARAYFVASFDQPVLAAMLLLVTGGLVWSVHRFAPGADETRPEPAAAFWVGVAQAFAILPGISRSGSTVAVGVWQGVAPVRMAEFSFLMSVPAIAGAALLQLSSVEVATLRTAALPLAAGFVAALVAGVVAIRLFVRALEHRSFHLFAWYCWGLGGLYLLGAAFLPALR